jgi:LPS export ABC transporter protein LptC
MQDLARDLEQAPLDELEDVQDFFLESYQIVVTDERGRLQYEGSGKQMGHWQNSNKITLEEPMFIIHQEKGPPIHLRSDRAEGKPDGDEVYLLGQVQLDREAFGDNDSIHAVTRDMTLWPKIQRGHTDAPVHAEGKKYQVDGEGMTVDLPAGTLELHNKVRGVYEY